MGAFTSNAPQRVSDVTEPFTVGWNASLFQLFAGFYFVAHWRDALLIAKHFNNRGSFRGANHPFADRVLNPAHFYLTNRFIGGTNLANRTGPFTQFQALKG
jgi:hypothetical protein